MCYRHIAPLGLWTHHRSIDIALRPDTSGFKATGAKVEHLMDGETDGFSITGNLGYSNKR